MTAKRQYGFTFLELIIVIAIIGLLTTFFISTSSGSTKKARDARRKSDIKQYQNALEVFASKNNTLYPSQTAAGGVQASTTLCTNLTLTGCSEDPLNANNPAISYKYQTNGTGSGSVTGTQYVLWAQLEATTGFWIVCSNGKTGQLASANIAGGTCPLP